MSADQTEPAAPIVSDTYIDFIARLYFDAQELAEARRRYQESGSYAEAIAYLVGRGNDLRHSPAYTTIPGGAVLIPRPGRGEGSLAYLSLSPAHLACRAFPDPQPQVEGVGEQTSATARQLSFWGECMGTPGEAGVPMHSPPKQARATRPKKLSYVEQPISRRYAQPVQGWVVKDRGLGYYAEEMRSGDGYLVGLVHLKSGREFASVLTLSLDHDRIRAWVSACAQLTDWNQGIQAILKEQSGEQKQRAWSRQLERIWYDQQTSVKRQLAFF